jgi:uncharacterized protein YxeA
MSFVKYNKEYSHIPQINDSSRGSIFERTIDKYNENSKDQFYKRMHDYHDKIRNRHQNLKIKAEVEFQSKTIHSKPLTSNEKDKLVDR